MPNNHDPKDDELLITCKELLNQCAYGELQRLLNARIAQGLALDTPAGIMLLGEIAGLLIDAGAEGRNERAVKDGLALLENNLAHFDGLVTRASLEYNRGNAKIALAELHTPNQFATPGLADHDLLLDAKNHYWRALKAHGRHDPFAQQLGTNLGNALRMSGRITEALTVYDDIIADDPTFSMARFHRGLALLLFERLSRTKTISLLQQAATDYAITADAPDAPPAVRTVASTMRDHTTDRLHALGYDAHQLQHETQVSKKEATQQSPYRHWTLQHHLGLSDHSLYCHCNGARRDDLMIATSGNAVSGGIVPRLELIINRLKAEFSTARLLYYQATTDPSWDLHEHDTTFAELFEGEHLSARTELLRTSFRLCLGVLDKIALGICELYDVADPGEKLYFESFWQPTARKGKASTRWTPFCAKARTHHSWRSTPKQRI